MNINMDQWYVERFYVVQGVEQFVVGDNVYVVGLQ